MIKHSKGWTVQRFGEVATITGGKRLPRGEKLTPYNTGHPYIRVSDMNESGIDQAGLQFVPMGIVPLISRYRVNAGDLYFSVAGTIGLVGEVPPSLDGANLTENADRISNIRMHKQFLLQILRSGIISLQTQSAITQNAQPKLALERLRKFEIPFPPLPEQRKIAQILGTWDEAIATTEKLIAALERRKRGLMQRLLTGQVRKKWQTAQLSEVSQVILSGVDKKTREDDTPVRLCNYTDVFYNAYITDSMPFMEATATQREIEKCTLLEDDVIITKDSETVAEIAQAATVSESMRNVICGYHLAIIRPNPELVSGPFLRELIMTPDIHYQFEKSANGVTRFGLTGSAIESVEVIFPSLERQKEIVDVLRTNDREVDLLRSYREQLETQKKGLMQRLLTGQVRVAG